MNPIVSIIIPIYNVEKFVEESLSSALNQSYENIEYIIVDDCGNDNSMSIVNKLTRSERYNNKNIKIIKQERNLGVSAARNKGVRCSSGDYIFFMDSDDIISPDCIELHIKAIIESGADFTIGGIDVIGKKTVHIPKNSHNIYNSSILQLFFRRKWDSGPWNKLVNKNFIIQNNIIFSEGIRYEDMLWGYYMAKYASQIETLPQSTYKYIIHDGSFVTSKHTANKINDLITVIKTIYDDEIKKEDFPFKEHYISFWKFNTALLLLNFNGSTKEKIDFYNSIKQIRSGINIYTLILKLPYWLFKLVLFIPYTIYKRL